MNNTQYNKDLLEIYGENVFISSNVEIRRPKLVKIGNHVAIDTGFYLTTAADIGDYIHIGPYVTCIGGPNGKLIMEPFSSIAAGSRIICGSDQHLGEGLVGPTIPEQYRDIVNIQPVIFKRFANIATNVVIMPGIILGEGSVVGACSYVNKNTEPWTIYVGCPAKPVAKRPKDKMIAYANELGYK